MRGSKNRISAAAETGRELNIMDGKEITVENNSIFENSSSDGGLGSDLLKIPKLARVKKKAPDKNFKIQTTGNNNNNNSIPPPRKLSDTSFEESSSEVLTIEKDSDNSSSSGIASFKNNNNSNSEEESSNSGNTSPSSFFECETKNLIETNLSVNSDKSQKLLGGLEFSFRGSENNAPCDNNHKSIGRCKIEDDGDQQQNDTTTLKPECVDRAVNPSVTRVIVNESGVKDKTTTKEKEENKNIKPNSLFPNLSEHKSERVPHSPVPSSGGGSSCAVRIQPERTNLLQISEKEKNQVGLCCAKSSSERDKLITTKTTDEQQNITKVKSFGGGSGRKIERFGSRTNPDNNNNGINGQNRFNFASNWQLNNNQPSLSAANKRTTSELNLTSPLEISRTREQLLIDKTRSSVKAMGSAKKYKYFFPSQFNILSLFKHSF